MSSSKEFRDFVLDQMRYLDHVVSKPMMGEFLLYWDGVLFGGIYDNRLLIKPTVQNKQYGLCEELPYENAKKPMYLVENLDDAEYLSDLIRKTCMDLQKKGL